MKKTQLNNLNVWWLITLVVIYMLVMDQFTDLIINREVDTIIQGVCSIVALMYTVFMMKIVINNLERIYLKQKKND